MHRPFGKWLVVGLAAIVALLIFNAGAAYQGSTLISLIGLAVVGSVFWTFRDVAAPGRSEQQHKSKAHLDALVSNSPVGIALFDADLRFIDLNDKAAEFDGIPKETHLGRTAGELLPEIGSKVESLLRQVRDTGEPILNLEIAGKAPAAPEQQQFWIANYFPVRAPDGSILAIGAVALDITERKRAEERLHEADRRKDEFLATLAHELRNPLAPIRNAVEILRHREAEPAVNDQALDIMSRQLAQLVRLVDDLLDVSRVGRGKVQLRKERVDLAAAARSALEIVGPLIEARGHQLIVSLPHEPIHLVGDPARLAQVISNLLNNAAKYTERNGRVWLTVEQQRREGIVSVRDTGIGIAAENQEHIFEMFSQLPAALERSQGGLGIGLSLVRGLVELHGGRVEVRSAGVGQGSEFIIRLPCG